LKRSEITPSDIRSLPAYGIPEAARYLGLPPSTFRAWALGQAGGDRPRFKAALSIADTAGKQLSFLDLVEAHVLSALRRKHGVPLQQIRRARSFLLEKFASPHPLAMYQFETDGLDVFVSRFNQLITASREGQLAMRDLISAYLKRVEWDNDGIAARLFLFTRKPRERSLAEEPKTVVLDPRISFGQPVIAGTGLRTSIIAERYKAGESVEELAKDYGREASEIQEAIRCELELKAA